MKPKQTAALITRLAVGLVLGASGIHLAAMPAAEFAVIVDTYGILPKDLVMPLAAVLPWIEAFVGVALATGYLARAACAGAGALFLLFIGALSSVLLRGIPLENCGCFGNAIHFTPLQTLGLDATMLAACVFLWRQPHTPAALDNWVEQGTL